MSRERRSYASYIQLAALLSSQQPATPPEEALTWGAERFFIICHQTSELWLSQILNDLAHAARLATIQDWSGARTPLIRAASLTLMLSRTIEQLAYLCPPSAFLRFREALAGASAIESRQLQEMLQLSGGRHPDQRTIEAALAAPSCSAEPASPGPQRKRSSDERAVANALGFLVRGVAIWRQFHLEVARYFIRDLPGTGGTSGIDYLKQRIAEDHKAEYLDMSVLPAQSAVEQLRSGLQKLEDDIYRLQTRSCRTSGTFA
jgi:tryptophan 2,3-dioxygenase